MTDKQEQRPQPKGPVPYVFSVGSANQHIAWIEKALGGKREMVMADPKDETKVMHAALQLNGGPIYLSDRLGNYGAPTEMETASRGTHLYLGFETLAQATTVWNSALKEKANIVMPFERQFWGSHYGVIEDPFGTVWAVSARNDELSQAQEKPVKQHYIRKERTTRVSKEESSKATGEKKATSKRMKH